eukprot:9399630-Prorocentrum_lima.AAC.1
MATHSSGHGTPTIRQGQEEAQLPNHTLSCHGSGSSELAAGAASLIRLQHSDVMPTLCHGSST